MQLQGNPVDSCNALEKDIERFLLEAEARLCVAENRVGTLERGADRRCVEVAAGVRSLALSVWNTSLLSKSGTLN
ncbi:MAG: hypothetical protein KAW17_03215 [Candidatus Eisenbacteria sp.]|nr:hypothetical protein [Candidatus Eisenbacteria bacterium]